MKKWWGIRSRVSPVAYIHENSPPVHSDYQSLKKKFDDLIERNELQPDKAEYNTLFWTLLIDSGELKQDGLEESIAANPNVRTLIRNMEVEFNLFKTYLNESGNYAYFYKLLNSFTRRIHDLLFHFRERDALIRSYIGQAKGKIKVLYDEREWRAIDFGYDPEVVRAINAQKDRSDVDDRILLLSDKDYRERAEGKGWLPSEHNLMFSDADVVAILVENEESIEKLREFIRTEQTLLNYEAVKDRIYPIDQFSEKS